MAKWRIDVIRKLKGCPFCALSTDAKMYTFALVGQPNSGKSTFYNSVVGYKVETANYPGTTVSFSSSLVKFGDHMVNLIDLPGTYTLLPIDKSEEVTFNFLLNTKVDGVIQIAEATSLAHALSLTLELLPLDIPMVLVVNMMDEAEAQGISIDTEKLSHLLGIPVIPAVAIKRRGTSEAIQALIDLIEKGDYVPFHERERNFDKELRDYFDLIDEVERVVSTFSTCKLRKNTVLNVYRLVKVLSDEGEREKLRESLSDEVYQEVLKSLSRLGDDLFEAFMERKIKASVTLAERVTVLKRTRRVKFNLDDLLYHPFFGKIITLLAFLGMFLLVYVSGTYLSELFEKAFEPLEKIQLPPTFWGIVLKGAIDGFLGGAEIVIPFAVPLLFILALLEDSGVLPRLAYIADTMFRFFGLSGRSVIPFVIGYGCTVPGIMALRSLPDERERRLSALLLPLIPCSARMVVLLAIAVPLIGPIWGFSYFIFNLIVVAIVGKILEKKLKLSNYGLIIAIPPYRLPSLRVALWKLYLRMKEFFVWAWPMLILGSILLELGEFYRFNQIISLPFIPLVKFLRIPVKSTVPLLFGLLKKELAVPMFLNAVGGLKAVTLGEALRFTIFTMFYIPCVSTIAVIWREYGGRWALLSSLVNLVTAIVVTMGFLWIK